MVDKILCFVLFCIKWNQWQTRKQHQHQHFLFPYFLNIWNWRKVFDLNRLFFFVRLKMHFLRVSIFAILILSFGIFLRWKMSFDDGGGGGDDCAVLITGWHRSGHFFLMFSCSHYSRTKRNHQVKYQFCTLTKHTMMNNIMMLLMMILYVMVMRFGAKQTEYDQVVKWTFPQIDLYTFIHWIYAVCVNFLIKKL